MKNYFFILFLFFLPVVANTQNPYLDSLKRELSTKMPDTTRVMLLFELSTWLHLSNPDTGLKLANEGIQLAQRINYKWGEAYCKVSLGFYLWAISDYTTSIKMAWSIMPYAQATDDYALQQQIYTLLLNAHKDNGDFAEALKCSYAITALEQKLHSGEPYVGYIERAFIFNGLNSLDSALYYIHRRFQEPGPKQGYEYLVMGNIQVKANHFDSALYYYKIGIEKLPAEANFKDLAAAYRGFATTYYRMGNNDSAIYYAQNGLSIAKQKLYAKEAMDLAALLATIYEKTNTDSALYHYKAAMLANDSLFSREKAKQVASYQFNEELRQQELKNAEKEYRNKIKTYGLVTGLAVFLGIAVLLWRNNKKRQRAYVALQQQERETEQQRAKAEAALEELKATQAQLVQREKMASLGELTAGIAHEIQNPLNFVNNFSEVNTELIDEMQQELKAGNSDEAIAISNNIKENQEKINNHGKRADAIVKGMLQHSRSSSGVKEPANINALADEYLRLAYHGLRAKDKSFNATLKTDFDESVEKIYIIPQDIGRVLLNLYNNAFYAVCPPTSQGGIKNPKKGYEPKVSVSTKKVGDDVFITVRDNGPGIPQKVIDKIFQPFFTTKPPGQGTGLGLSLSYDIVKAHGGEIKVSTVEGEGAKFVVELPV